MLKSSKVMNVLMAVVAVALLFQAAVLVRERLLIAPPSPDSVEGAREAVDRLCNEAQSAYEIINPGLGCRDSTLTLTVASHGEPAIINVTYRLDAHHRLTRSVCAAGEKKIIESSVVAERVMTAYFFREGAGQLRVYVVVMSEPKKGRRFVRTVTLTPAAAPSSSAAAPSRDPLAQAMDLPTEVKTPQTPSRAELRDFIANFHGETPMVEHPEHYCPNCGAFIGKRDPCPNCARSARFLCKGTALRECRCGAANLDTWEFCYKCGLKLAHGRK